MSTLEVDNLKGVTSANDVKVTVGASVTQSLKNGIAKTFFRYDLRTGPTLETNLNVSTAVDDGTGMFSINLTNNLSSENSTSLSGAHTYDESPSQNFSSGSMEIGTESTSELEGYTGYGGTKYDTAQIFGQQYGDLA